MEYGICVLSVIPMRADGNDRSEQVSQLLFGETYEILQWQDRWVQIRTNADQYEGWIARLHVKPLGHVDYTTLQSSSPSITFRAVTQAWKTPDNSVLYLPATSNLAFFSGTACVINNEKFELVGETGNDFANLTEAAYSYLNTPYQWGGRTHFGIDCSGFSQAVYRMFGLQLMRDASQQATQGTTVDFVTEVKAGDLAFFDNAEGNITHVGILLSPDTIIHASGQVKADCFDSEGIYSVELKRYTHKLRIIKRYTSA